MKRDTARALGISRLSDLKRYWPAVAASASRATARAAADPRQNEQWTSPRAACSTCSGAWALSRGQGVTVALVDTGARLEHPDLAPNVWTSRVARRVIATRYVPTAGAR